MDAHHILFLGGAQWDSNFSVFGKPFDSNVVYTFHKYSTAPDESVIRDYMDFRDRFDVPIWMGESGENNDDWIAQFVKTLEKNNIGWAFWPYKKMGKSSAVVSILPPADWAKIVEFAKLPRGTGQVEERLKARPDLETIVRAFDQFLENMRLQGKRQGQHLASVMECQEYGFAESFDVRHHPSRATGISGHKSSATSYWSSPISSGIPRTGVVHTTQAPSPGTLF